MIDALQEDFQRLVGLTRGVETSLRSESANLVRLVEASSSLLHFLVFTAGSAGLFIEKDDRWKQNVIVPLAYRIWRACHASYVLVLAGRADEAHILMRSAVETQALLFLACQDPSIGKRWAQGHQIKPSLVRKALSQVTSQMSLDVTRPLYSTLSDYVHGNAAVFERFEAKWIKVEQSPVELLAREFPFVDHHDDLNPVLTAICSSQLACSNVLLKVYGPVLTEHEAAAALRVNPDEVREVWSAMWDALCTEARARASSGDRNAT